MVSQLPLIWVVNEDDEDVIFMQQAVSSLGNPCRLLVFPDCTSLIAHVSGLHAPPKLIVIDYFLKEMNGLELTGVLRLMPILNKIPISWLGEDLVLPSSEQLEKLGVNWCWPKPDSYKGWQEIMQRVCVLVRQQSF